MAYVVVQDVAVSWDRYIPIAAAFAERTPRGLILHAAGPTDEGVRLVGVWESQADWRAFQSDALLPLEAVSSRRPSLRELHPGHLVVATTSQCQHGSHEPRGGGTHVT